MSDKFKVVISGLSGRFPECDDVDTFKEKLFTNGDFITVDNRKWSLGYKQKQLDEERIPDATGKYLSVHEYDHLVFKMNKAFAFSNDIINRKILEPSFEAIVDAGVNPYSLDGSNVSVFMSTGTNEFDNNNSRSLSLPSDFLGVIGGNKTMLSNRVSYALNLTGPSFTNHVDVHGALESLILGYRYVSEGLVEAAIVGVASSIVDPRLQALYFSWGLLSPDGVTRAFDKLADGYARSEGLVCFYLQRAEDAKRSYGEIIFCDSCFLGSDLPTFINCGESYLKTCMHRLLDSDSKSKFKLSNIAFVEMNAYGHTVQDKIESNVVAELIAKQKDEPLLVGSIKSNIGHVEAAAGLMAVLKGLLVLDSGTVTPNRHLQKLNDDIEAFKTNQLQVVTEKHSLPGNTVAVNSIGLFGTVGLAIIRQHEKVPVLPPAESYDAQQFPRILLICGRQENDLKTKLTKAEKSPYTREFIALANSAFREYMPLHMYRGFTLLPSSQTPVNCIMERGDQNRPVWLIFSGMGSQWNGMGKSLLKLPLFSETVAKCDRVLRRKNIDIYHILTTDDSTLFDDIVNAFVGIITIQIGLYEVFKALDIKVDGIIGHSVGENACAYADGCLSLEQAVLASWARGMASNEVKTVAGMMAAVGKGYEKMKDVVPEGIQVACHNSENSCTLTGPAELVESYVQELKRNGVFAKAVNVANIAYHSKYIAPIGPRLLHRLEQVIEEPKQRSSKWISTSVPESRWDTPLAQYCSAEYLTNNLLSPVLFEEGCKHIPENAICIEFAPHGLLQAILKRSLPDSCTNIPLTHRGKIEENLNFLLSSIGMLYIAGLDPDVNNIFPPVEFPVPRGTPHISPYCSWYHRGDPVPFYLRSLHEEDLSLANELIPVCVREDSDYAYLRDYRVDNRITIPQSFFVFLVWKMFCSKFTEDKLGPLTVVLECLTMHQHDIIISTLDTKYASVMIHYGSGNFRVILLDYEDSEDFQVILTGRIQFTSGNVTTQLVTSTLSTDKFVSKTKFFNASLLHAGYKLGKEFVLVKEIECHNRKYRGEITWNGNWVTFIDALMKVQMFADNKENVKDIVPTCIQRLEITISEYQLLSKGTVLPYGIDTHAKELLCPGIVMRSLKYKRLSKPEAQMKSFRFVSYPNPRCQCIPEFLHLCLQIAVENLKTPMSSTSDVHNLAVLDMTGKYWQVVEEIINKKNTSKLIVILDSPKKFKVNECTHVFMITNEMEKLVELDRPTSIKKEFILAITPTPLCDEEKFGQCFTKLVQQSFSVNTFTLLKKKAQNPTYNLNNLNESKINIQTASSLSILSENIHFDDVSRLMKIKPDHLDERYLYIMDVTVSKQKLDKLVQKQAELDVPVLVSKQGELGSYRNLTLENFPAYGNEIITDTYTQLIQKISAGPKKVSHVCFDRINHVPSKHQIFGFSYVAAVNTSEQQMGLAVISLTGDLQYDPYLHWTIPCNYSLDEAAKMIYVYTRAYKLFLLLPLYCLKRASTIMINVGTDYLLAEAFIVLSLYQNLKIFLTIDSDENAVLIRDRFPEIQYDHIFSSKNCSYIQVTQKTKRKGVDLLVNCLPGIEHVETSLKCLAIDGIYIEVGTDNCQKSNEMGLHSFLKGASFQTLQKRVSDLLKLPAETKRMMRKFIGSCIKKEIIVPLRLDLESLESMKFHLKKEIQNNSTSTMKYDKKRSYLILGTNMKDSSLFELIEWLADQGACKFIIAFEEFKMLAQTEYQMNQLLTRTNVHTLFTSASKLDDRQEASSFLKQVEKIGPLEATFFVGIKMPGKKISNLNDLVSPNVYFVGLSSAGLKEFEQRRANGSPAVLLHSDEGPKDVMSALPRLNKLLAHNNINNAEILYHITNPSRSIDHSTKSVNFNLRDYLPNNMKILNLIGEEETEEPSFIEMSSLSMRYLHCKGVYPIFALPAIHSSTLQPLFQRLQYPVFSATTTSMNSVKELARKLYSSLEKIQPTGPITIISETWTLPLALELKSYAQCDSRGYKLLILEGIPQVWSDRVKQLQSSGPDLHAVCVAEIFHFIRQSNNGLYGESVSFENNVEMLVGNAIYDLKTMQNVVKAAKKIRRIITELKSIPFANEILEHSILFERCRPNERVLKLSVTSETIVIDEPNYRKLLQNPEVSRAINSNVQFSWWKYSLPQNGGRSNLSH